MLIKAIIMLAVVTVITTAVGGGYLWLERIVAEKQKLAVENAKFVEKIDEVVAANAGLERVIGKWAKAQEDTNATLEKLTAASTEAAKESVRIRGILGKHDLEKLALAKPGLIERRINRGSAAAARMLTMASKVRPKGDRKDSGGEGSGIGTPAAAQPVKPTGPQVEGAN